MTVLIRAVMSGQRLCLSPNIGAHGTRSGAVRLFTSAPPPAAQSMRLWHLLEGPVNINHLRCEHALTSSYTVYLSHAHNGRH